MPRIAHIITQFELGGAQQTTLTLLRHLAACGIAPTLITSPGGLLEAEARAVRGLEVRTLPSLGRTIHPWRDAAALHWLERFIHGRRFDLVHTHSSKAGILGRWAAWLAGVPVICHTIHGFGFHAKQPAGARRSFQALERATARITTRLISVSRYDQTTGLRAGIGRPEQYVHIPYGIDLRRFHRNGLCPQSARVRIGLDPNAPTIGTVACLKPQKAPEDFLEVCARVRRVVPQLQTILVGDGVLRLRVERRIRQLQLNDTVYLLGWRRDIPEILTALDVFALTSRWEGLPVAVLEAQAMGVPVVATDTGGIRDVITHGEDGWLAPVSDIGRLSEGVTRLLRERAFARTVSQRAHARVVQDHAVERMVTQTEAVYEEMLATVRRSAWRSR